MSNMKDLVEILRENVSHLDINNELKGKINLLASLIVDYKPSNPLVFNFQGKVIELRLELNNGIVTLAYIITLEGKIIEKKEISFKQPSPDYSAVIESFIKYMEVWVNNYCKAHSPI